MPGGLSFPMKRQAFYAHLLCRKIAMDDISRSIRKPLPIDRSGNPQIVSSPKLLDRDTNTFRHLLPVCSASATVPHRDTPGRDTPMLSGPGPHGNSPLTAIEAIHWSPSGRSRGCHGAGEHERSCCPWQDRTELCYNEPCSGARHWALFHQLAGREILPHEQF